MSDGFTVFLIIYTFIGIRIYRTESQVYRKLKNLKQSEVICNALVLQRKRVKHTVIQGVIILLAGITIYRMLG